MKDMDAMKRRLETMYGIRDKVYAVLKDYDISEFNRVYKYMRDEFGKAEANRLVNIVVTNAKQFQLDLDDADRVRFIGDTEDKRRAFVFMNILNSGELDNEEKLITIYKLGKIGLQRLCETSIVNKA